MDAPRAYRIGYLLVLIGCFLPAKSIGYALPFAFFAWMAAKAPHAIRWNRVVAILIVVAVLPLIYVVIDDEFLIVNYLLAVVTYSSFLPIAVLDGRQLESPDLVERLAVPTSWMIALQGVIGVIQALAGEIEGGSFGGGNGDRVQGTIHLSLQPESSFSNPMFATNITLMLLVCLAVPSLLKAGVRRRLLVGVVALVLASVVHVLIFAALALVVALIVIETTRGRGTGSYRNLVIGGLLAGALTYAALPDNVANISGMTNAVIDFDALSVPRAIMLYRVATELPDEAPYQPYVGLGPGQFSSRASLIASGLYLGGANDPQAPPFLTPQATRLAADYCLSLLIAYADQGEVIGSTHQPFFSVLSVYTELGALGLVLVGWVVVRIVRRARQRAAADPTTRYRSVLFVAGVVFVAMLGLQENYWEVPQAILIGLLLLRALGSNLRQAPRSAGPSTP